MTQVFLMRLYLGAGDPVGARRAFDAAVRLQDEVRDGRGLARERAALQLLEQAR